MSFFLAFLIVLAVLLLLSQIPGYIRYRRIALRPRKDPL